ncbi:gamma carbonic anhydrase family protein [Guggenheimella bovis]
MILKYLNKEPILSEEAFVAPDATVIGDVEIEKDASIWFQAVIRGDEEPIRIGEGSNIQDLTMVHVSKDFPTTIGRYVTVGHAAIVHGCEIGDYTLIGMGATVLDGAKIGNHCIIGANSLVSQNKVIPDGSMVYGSPAKVIRSLSEEEIRFLEEHAKEYIDLSKNYILEEKR